MLTSHVWALSFPVKVFIEHNFPSFRSMEHTKCFVVLFFAFTFTYFFHTSSCSFFSLCFMCAIYITETVETGELKSPNLFFPIKACYSCWWFYFCPFSWDFFFMWHCVTKDILFWWSFISFLFGKVLLT